MAGAAQYRAPLGSPAPNSQEFVGLPPLDISDEERTEVEQAVKDVFANYNVALSQDDPILAQIPVTMRVMERVRELVSSQLQDAHEQIAGQVSHLIMQVSNLIQAEYRRQSEEKAAAVDVGIELANQIVAKTKERVDAQLKDIVANVRGAATEALQPLTQQATYAERIEKASKRIVTAVSIFTVVIVGAVAVMLMVHWKK
jgi:hypothetical protein